MCRHFFLYLLTCSAIITLLTHHSLWIPKGFPNLLCLRLFSLPFFAPFILLLSFLTNAYDSFLVSLNMNWLKVSQQVRNTFLFLITPAAERQWGSVTRGLIEPGKLSRLQCGGCLQQKVLFWFANSRMESALMRVASLDMRSSLQYQGKLTYREIYTHPWLFSESAPDWCTLLNFLNRCWGSAAGQHVVQTALRPNQIVYYLPYDDVLLNCSALL